MNRKLFLAIIIFIISFALIFFWVWPVYKNWDKSQTELKEMKDLVAQMQKATLSVDAFDSENYFEDLSKLKQAMPIGTGTEELLVTFENLATSNGLLLNALNFSEEKDDLSELLILEQQTAAKDAAKKDDNELKKLKIQAELTGSYSSLKSFLKSCEKNIRVINVKKITFSRVSGLGSSQSASDIFKFSLELETYYLESGKTI